MAQEVAFDVNLIQNSTLDDGGLAGWAPFGSRTTTLSVHSEEDDATLPITMEQQHEHDTVNKPSGRYILVSGRADEKDGLRQAITGALKPRVTYRVAGWVSLGASSPENAAVRVNLAVDGDEGLVECGAVSAEAGRWTEVKGAFRLRTEPHGAAVYVQGAPAGVDVKVMDLRVFATDRKARFRLLKDKTDKMAQEVAFDVNLIQNSTLDDGGLAGWAPFGSRTTTLSVHSEEDDATLPITMEQQHEHDTVNKPSGRYILVSGRADEKDGLRQAITGALKPRVTYRVAGWVSLGASSPENAAVRVNLAVDGDEGLVECGAVSAEAGRWTEVKGAFRLRTEPHGAAVYVQGAPAGVDVKVMDLRVFATDRKARFRLLKDKTDKYIELIKSLQRGGAEVRGIGLQGHVSNPVGQVICDALDKLATTGIPIWFTELDVPEQDVGLRAQDLEVVLREAYAHPAVQGVVLWGFLQGTMWRQNAWLVNADGTVNEAGQMFANLQKEWKTDARGNLDGDGNFKFRGFHGKYFVEVKTATGKQILRTFTVDKGDNNNTTPLVLDLADA
ncbi:hypothetical protein ACQ4PT_018726 [Festuca glaucescens]